MVVVLLSMLSSHSLSPVVRDLSAKEEVVEQIFRCHIAHIVVMAATTTSASRLPLLEGCGTAHLIILSPLLGIAETSHRRVNLLKGFSRFWMRVLVWMHLDGSLLEPFFNVVLSRILFHTQN